MWNLERLGSCSTDLVVSAASWWFRQPLGFPADGRNPFAPRRPGINKRYGFRLGCKVVRPDFVIHRDGSFLPVEQKPTRQASALLLPAVVPIAQSLKLRRLQSWFASRLRTEQLDNTGARVTCHLEDGGEAEWRELPCDGFGLLSQRIHLSTFSCVARGP